MKKIVSGLVDYLKGSVLGGDKVPKQNQKDSLEPYLKPGESMGPHNKFWEDTFKTWREFENTGSWTSPSPKPKTKSSTQLTYLSPQNSGEFLEQYVFPITDGKIPRAVAAGMLVAENRDLLDSVGKNNGYNIGANDSNPHNARRYQDFSDGVEDWVNLLQTLPRYSKVWEQGGDPEKMLLEIQNAGYAGDPGDWYQRKLKEDPNFPYKSYSEFIMNTPEWKQYFGGQ